MAIPRKLEQKDEKVSKMSNSKEHALFGFLVGTGAYLLAKRIQNEKINWGNALGWGVVGAGVALVPDILEPALSPIHRGAAHSLVAGGTVLYATKKAWDSENLTSDQKTAVASVAAAYLSHLIADSTTPAGLPIL